MSFEIILTKSFKRSAKPLVKRHASFEQDMEGLQEELLTEPRSGDALGRDCFKIRMAIASKGKGKSGGARAITCVKIVGETIYLLTIFDKSEQESISDNERDELLCENGLV